jgi:pyruvate dehydrogenase E2 component (dihydrolipoamide acetyltransferase)
MAIFDGVTATRKPQAAPAVRKRARELGIELASVSGSGPGGRILREDLDTLRPAAAEAPAPAPAGERIVPLRGIRRTIARTMTEAWRTIPHIIDYREVDATEIRRVRAALKQTTLRAGDERAAGAITITPLIVKVAVDALRRHPYVNASIDVERDEIRLHGDYHIGIATAAPDGLIVPVVHHADRKTLTEVALEVADLAGAARERRLRPEQLAGGTFTVNNYGALGIWLGTPIIKPPEVANLGVGRMQERAVVVDGEIVARPIIALAVSGDHRILDGHTLAAFVSDVARLIENPSLLLADSR